MSHIEFASFHLLSHCADPLPNIEGLIFIYLELQIASCDSSGSIQSVFVVLFLHHNIPWSAPFSFSSCRSAPIPSFTICLRLAPSFLSLREIYFTVDMRVEKKEKSKVKNVITFATNQRPQRILSSPPKKGLSIVSSRKTRTQLRLLPSCILSSQDQTVYSIFVAKAPNHQGNLLLFIF